MGNDAILEPVPARVGYFGGLRIQWDERVIEPRDWTIEQAEWLAELGCRTPAGDVLELCAGVGHLGIVLADLTGRSLVQVELDPCAADHARVNAENAGLAADVRTAGLTEALRDDERFALILSDPPWVRSDEVHGLPEHPEFAIDGGDDGLDVARVCVRLTAKHLASGGHAVLQLGSSEQVAQLWDELGPECARLDLVEIRDRSPRGVLAHMQARPV